MGAHRWVLVAAILAVGCGGGELNRGTGDGDGGGGSSRDGGSPRDGGSGGRTDGGGGPGPGTCVDHDGDGYGPGCGGGVDCDDSDPTRNVGCEGTSWGLGGEVFDPADPDQTFDHVEVDGDGNLTLGGGMIEDDSFVWAANSAEGTISKLDARTGREVARYPSVVSHPENHGRPWNEECDMESTGNCPSRTALDFRRDAWVANRAFGHRGTVTKVANYLEDCVDLNGDGTIQTSHDANGDGVISLGDPAEFLADADECVLFTVDVGERNELPRALAIAPDPVHLGYGSAWVGLNAARKAVELRGTDGSVLREVALDINPYGALADKHLGVVWFTNAGWQAAPDNPPGVQNVDFETGAVSRRFEIDQPIPGCDQQFGTYGITVDEDGRVWVAGYPCQGAFRLDPMSATWTAVPTPDHGGPRGLVADGQHHIYMAHSHCDGTGTCATLSRFNTDSPFDLQRIELRPTGASGSIGVDIDLNGLVWVINNASSNATRYNPTTGAIDQFPVGNGPYTYSDFTGHGLLTQFPRGYFRGVSEACDDAVWQVVSFDAETPPGSRIEVSVRTAPTRDALRMAPWTGVWTMSPARLVLPPGPVANGRFLELQLAMLSEAVGAIPSVSHVDVTYQCPLM